MHAGTDHVSSNTRKAAEALRRFALGFPEAYEEFPWGHSAFKVNKKVFVFMSADNQGLSLSVKLPASGRAALSQPFAEPTGYGLGKSGWVSARFGPRERPPLVLLRAWIDESYRAIAPKGLTMLLSEGPAGARAGASDSAAGPSDDQPSRKRRGAAGMPTKDAKPKLMSDAAVEAKTGRTWPEWFAILDNAGAKKMTHKEIVGYLAQKHVLSLWWRQMVTVSYERERGLRKVHERPDGYSISRSKTIPAPAARLFEAWTDARTRRRWLGAHDLTISKATPGKSVRITWRDPSRAATKIEVMFYPKGEDKAQVVVQHDRLSSSAQAKEMKGYWGEKLEELARLAT